MDNISQHWPEGLARAGKRGLRIATQLALANASGWYSARCRNVKTGEPCPPGGRKLNFNVRNARVYRSSAILSQEPPNMLPGRIAAFVVLVGLMRSAVWADAPTQPQA